MLYRLADRLLLLKCYDNKMVKLPGCSSIRGIFMKLTNNNNKKVLPNLLILTFQWDHYLPVLNISTSVWVLCTPDASQDILFLCFSHILQDFEAKMKKNEAKQQIYPQVPLVRFRGEFCQNFRGKFKGCGGGIKIVELILKFLL